MKKTRLQLHHRHATPLVRHVLPSLIDGPLIINQATAELGISRSRLLKATPPASYSFAASEVMRRHGLKLHRASVRRFAMEQDLASDTSWKNKPAAIRRWQRLQIGSLWQLDATPHRWFPGQAKLTPLLNMLDDCSRLTVGVTLYPAETLLAYLDFLPRAFLQHGLPLQIYVDYHSFFITALPESLTQPGAPPRFYDMSFRYVLQMTARAAWKLALKEGRSVLRAAPNCPWWPYVWSVRTQTRVGEDGRVSVCGHSLRIEKPRRTRVTRCQHTDGTWTILANPPLKNSRPEILLYYQP